MTSPKDPLVETVAALREEIAGLRESARLRAVIEQAKGVLVERHGITLDEAFHRLRAMSQEHNVRLVEVAATVVGTAVPDGTDAADTAVDRAAEDVVRERLPASPRMSPAWDALRQQPDIRAGVTSALLDSLTGSADHGDEAAGLLAEMLAPQGVAALTMFRVAGDGSLRFVGQVGVPGDTLSAWRSIPPSRDIPYVRSVVDDTSFFWGDRAARDADFPSVATAASPYVATATVPVRDQGAVIGVVGLMWSEQQSFDGDRRHEIEGLVARVAPLLLRHVVAADPELEWLRTLLSQHLDPWVVLEGTPSSDGIARDFVVHDVSPEVPGGADWSGRRILELWPVLALDGTAASLASVARGGGAWTSTVVAGSEAPWGREGSRLRAVRIGPRVVVVWRLPG